MLCKGGVPDIFSKSILILHILEEFDVWFNFSIFSIAQQVLSLKLIFLCIFHPFSGHKLVNRTVWIESILSTNQANCVTILESFRNYIKQKIQKFQELQDPKPNYVILIKKCVAIPDTYLFIVTRSAIFSYLTESLLEIFTTCMFNMHKKEL